MSTHESRNKESIIGRQKEMELLTRLLRSNRAELLAVYGRRRVGKTFLVRSFFRQEGVYFELTGTKDAKRDEQLRNFSRSYVDVFGHAETIPRDWQEAFHQLRLAVEQVPRDQKVILFFDELPWLASRRSGFLSALDYFWNRHASQWSHVIVIVCGSAAAWMIHKVINNRAGLYGRLTAQIRLLPFDLVETTHFLHVEGIVLTPKQVAEVYLALGGVAKYLTMVSKGRSAAQMIQETCFSSSSPLATEFPKLYASLFDGSSKHVSIVRALAKKRMGMTQHELLQETRLQSGGGFSRLLEELQESGFVAFVPEFSKRKKEGRWRLVDEYSLFYLCWIEPLMTRHLQRVPDDYWIRTQASPAYRAWAGYAFEGICLKHLDRLLAALHLSVVVVSASGWIHRSDQKDEKGAQIDLVIDRSDGCINLCELKFSDEPYVVKKEIAQEWERKKALFRAVTGTKKALIFTLVTASGVHENTHFHSCVDRHVDLTDLFHL